MRIKKVMIIKLAYYEGLDPYINQALEEILFLDEDTDDLILLWRNTPTVVCGYYQSLNAEVDLVMAYEKKIPLIRRISGGGTVYHDLGNINISFMVATKGEKKVSYEQFLEPLSLVLQTLGIEAEIKRNSDLMIKDHKISGNAQKITAKRILHHGTLLYDCDLEALRLLANGAAGAYRTRGTSSRPWPVTNMKEHSKKDYRDTETFLQVLREALQLHYHADVFEITEDHIIAAEKLAEEKYRSLSWTFEKNPYYSFTTDFFIQDKAYHIDYQVKKGRITEVECQPVFLRLSEGLQGVLAEPIALQKRCEQIQGLPDSFYKRLL